jgi:hypothetical protein
MYAYVDQGLPLPDDEAVVILLTRDEAARLVALLRYTETSGEKEPGSTLYTSLRREGIEPDSEAMRLARRFDVPDGGAVSIASDQGWSFWWTQAGDDYLCREGYTNLVEVCR